MSGLLKSVPWAFFGTWVDPVCGYGYDLHGPSVCGYHNCKVLGPRLVLVELWGWDASLGGGGGIGVCHCAWFGGG